LRRSPLTGKNYLPERFSEGALWALQKDMARLRSLGFTVLEYDLPEQLVLTEEQRQHWRDRPDLVAFRQGFLWETKYRDYPADEALSEGVFLMPQSQYEMLRRWRQKLRIPLYVSVYFKGEWMGYADIQYLDILQKVRSQKHDETFYQLPLWNLNTDLSQLTGKPRQTPTNSLQPFIG